MNKRILTNLSTAVMCITAFNGFSQVRDSLGYTGAMQTWTVPACVTEITVTLAGGHGGYSNNGSGKCCKGGNAGRVVGTLTVVPSSTLNIFVGGVGADAKAPFGVLTAGGFNGGGGGSYNSTFYAGGGGGGATDIRVGGVALANRVVVAGGGGGGAYNYGCGGPGPGPDRGGPGGGLTGSCGYEDNILSCGGPSNGGGGGGSQIAGGAGGNFSASYCTGAPGVLGVGGDGCEPDNSGGGGGGGYYGGGAGNWEGGGGGSNYIAGLDSVISNLQGSDSNTAYVIISYANPLQNIAPITGPTVVCAGMTYTYSCDTAAGATYTWSFPAGTVINSGQGKDSVHVTFGGTAGTVKVVAVGTCGSDSATLIVTKVNPLPTVTLSATKDTICVNNIKDSLIVSPLGGTLSGAGVTGHNFNPNTAGVGAHKVYYSYTDSNGCVNSDSIVIKVNVCAGIDEVANLDNAVKLYPNPFSNEVNVNVDVDGIVSISMFNMLGENMGTWQINKGNHVINTQGIPAGVYTMEINTQYGVVNRKLVKMN